MKSPGGPVSYSTNEDPGITGKDARLSESIWAAVTNTTDRCLIQNRNVPLPPQKALSVSPDSGMVGWGCYSSLRLLAVS